MTQQSIREPRYHTIAREADLEQLIPGDRVSAQLYHGRNDQFVFQGIDHGEKEKTRINSQSIAYFIELPPGHPTAANTPLYVRKTAVRYLQFDGSNVHFDHLHLDTIRVEPTNPRYDHLKSLIQRLG